MTHWSGRAVLVTGGASFIGSHLVDQLLARGARVRVADDLSSGRLENLDPHVDAGRVDFRRVDLLEQAATRDAVRDVEVLFHLAADHGGRGYVDLHPAECSTNLVLDGMLIREAHRAGVDKVVYASSGCVYPNHLQRDTEQEVYLREEAVGPPYDADNLYGWAKLMGELTLRAYHRRHGLKAACCRYFTVYGPRGVENHAVLAMIARAFVGQDPFEVWGDGRQVRNWTFVDDIVSGTILAAERIDDGTAVNLGTMERTRVVDAVEMVLDYTGHQAELRFLPHMPTGPMNRVADNVRARRLLGWEPRVLFREGLARTIDWYFSTQDREAVVGRLASGLTERNATDPGEGKTRGGRSSL